MRCVFNFFESESFHTILKLKFKATKLLCHWKFPGPGNFHDRDTCIPHGNFHGPWKIPGPGNFQGPWKFPWPMENSMAHGNFHGRPYFTLDGQWYIIHKNLKWRRHDITKYNHSRIVCWACMMAVNVYSTSVTTDNISRSFIVTMILNFLCDYYFWTKEE